jgi:hypothetical protein
MMRKKTYLWPRDVNRRQPLTSLGPFLFAGGGELVVLGVVAVWFVEIFSK